MQKSDVIAFFDSRAADWDREMIKSDEIISEILTAAGVGPNTHVLDIACGTGVLIPYYLDRQVASVTAVDISSEMIRIAQGKFQQEHVRFLCGDAETLEFDEKFDCILVYNAFPHFPNPTKLIHRLAGLLKQGGKLTVAHGMSRAEIDRRHRGQASKVSVGMLHEDALAEIFEKDLEVCVKISDENRYQITGIKGK